VSYRLALDHPQAVRRLAILDIIPTYEVWARIDHRFALGYWHWSFLAQPHPVPETLIGHDPEYFMFQAEFRGQAPAYWDPEAFADYAAAVRTPQVIHGMCEDYRVGVSFDPILDKADKDAGRKITCPVLVLWGARGAVGLWYKPLEVWAEWASDLRGHAIESGHFIPEEKPVETLAALRGFFSERL